MLRVDTLHPDPGVFVLAAGVASRLRARRCTNLLTSRRADWGAATSGRSPSALKFPPSWAWPAFHHYGYEVCVSSDSRGRGQVSR